MMEKFWIARAERAGKAMEKDMNPAELQRILGYVNIGLAIAHDSGVSIGHFECGDFIQLAQTVNGMLLHAIAPATGVGVGSALVVGAGSVAPGTACAV
jgi:hypothetical protein